MTAMWRKRHKGELRFDGVGESDASSNSISQRVSRDVRNMLRDLSGASAPKQLAFGACAGWLSGFVTVKMGKMAATAIGGSLLLLQIAHYRGYITLDWRRLNDDSSSVTDYVVRKIRDNSEDALDHCKEFVAENAYVAGGFAGGFFLGFASA